MVLQGDFAMDYVLSQTHSRSQKGGRSQKGYKGPGMEGFTAKWYAGLTRKSIEDFQALARRVAAELPPGSRVLEVAPGPGYFAIELAKLGASHNGADTPLHISLPRGYRITGLDISRTFVDIARRNALEARVAVEFRHGNAAHMPFESSSFDFLLCRAAFKNFSEPLRALQDMYRVLSPGGRALIIDLRKDAPPDSVDRAVDQMHLGAVNSILTKFTFRHMLLKRAYTSAVSNK
jgi:ubiquinone/menaquinone biosynthesis C-methylase UbiE